MQHHPSSMQHSNNPTLNPQLPPHPLDRLPDQLRKLGAGPHQVLIRRHGQQIHPPYCPQERRLRGSQSLVVLVEQLHHKVHPRQHQNRRLQLRVAAGVGVVAEQAVVEELERHVRRFWGGAGAGCCCYAGGPHSREGGRGVKGRRDRGARRAWFAAAAVAFQRHLVEGRGAGLQQHAGQEDLVRGLAACAVDGVVGAGGEPGFAFEGGEFGDELGFGCALADDGFGEAVYVGWAGEVVGVGEGLEDLHPELDGEVAGGA
jgi:hypothetical protein